MTTHQAADAAKPGRLGKDDNAVCRHFFPARRVALRRTTAGVAVRGKAASHAVGPQLVGLPPRNAMLTVPQ